MIRISYVSTAKLGTTDSDLAELMSVAGKRNAAPGIRGLLGYNDRNFMQALGGRP
jgi:hypothetical protein